MSKANALSLYYLYNYVNNWSIHLDANNYHAWYLSFRIHVIQERDAHLMDPTLKVSIVDA